MLLLWMGSQSKRSSQAFDPWRRPLTPTLSPQAGRGSRSGTLGVKFLQPCPNLSAGRLCLGANSARRVPLMRGAKVAKTDNARRLRRNATIAEQRLWYRLRSRSLYGMKFVRQEPIGPYIADFVCRKHRLIIEVDGGQHCENVRDVVRDRWLREHGYCVLRFWNNDVIRNIDGVLETIASAFPNDGPAPSPRLRLAWAHISCCILTHAGI
jgi:very-short-patch-repair endonuclease